MKKTTVYSLSRELGVSPSAVSKALNNSPELNPETAARIRRRADELGFRPRPISTRTANICALIQTPEINRNCFSPYTVSVMQGMMEYLQENELEFSILSDGVDRLNNGTLLRQLGKRNISGAVLLNTGQDSTFIEQLDQNGFPYCCLLTGNSGNPERLLTVDNAEAAAQAVSYLIQLGHRNIATLVSPSGRERLKGYRAALERAGILQDPGFVVIANTETEGLQFGYSCTVELFRARPEITALLVMGERVAIGAMHAFYQMGISIPGQVSLIAFDDAPEAAFLNPPLTVVRIPNEKLGYTAARRVHQMISTPNDARNIRESWMCGELVIRASTAPPGR